VAHAAPFHRALPPPPAASPTTMAPTMPGLASLSRLILLSPSPSSAPSGFACPLPGRGASRVNRKPRFPLKVSPKFPADAAPRGRAFSWARPNGADANNGEIT